ncbi:anti-sigma factor antagonist [Rhodobacterales bacterium HKCCE3408]|nr:anti-sigma factor antagonist [Rhodobacterales bacterium HKCCE3408]
MNLTTNSDGPVTVVTVTDSRIDAAVAVDFKEAFRDALDGSGEGPVVLDLSAVDFLDSSGLGAVVAARKLLGEGRPLELAGLSVAVAKVMQLTRMDRVFRIHDSLADAQSAHRPPAA